MFYTLHCCIIWPSRAEIQLKWRTYHKGSNSHWCILTRLLTAEENINTQCDEVDTLAKNVDDNCDWCEDLEAKVATNTDNVSTCLKHNDQTDVKSRQKILVIEGYPENTTQNLCGIVDNLLSDLQVNFTSAAADAVYRRGKKPKSTKARPCSIIVVFGSQQYKAQVFSNVGYLKDYPQLERWVSVRWLVTRGPSQTKGSNGDKCPGEVDGPKIISQKI